MSAARRSNTVRRCGIDAYASSTDIAAAARTSSTAPRISAFVMPSVMSTFLQDRRDGGQQLGVEVVPRRVAGRVPAQHEPAIDELEAGHHDVARLVVERGSAGEHVLVLPGVAMEVRGPRAGVVGGGRTHL